MVLLPRDSGTDIGERRSVVVDKEGEWEGDRVVGDMAPLFRRTQWKIVRKARLMTKDTDGDLRRRKTEDYTGGADGSKVTEGRSQNASV